MDNFLSHVKQTLVHADNPRALRNFLNKVTECGDCWYWTGASNGRYGRVRSPKYNRVVFAHRLAWEWANGPIADGLVIDHVGCNQTHCVNPAHMRVCTPLENWERSDNPAMLNKKKTRCWRGHEFDKVNSRGERQCSKCIKIRLGKLPEEPHIAAAFSEIG